MITKVSLNWTAIVAAIFTVGGSVSLALGHPALADAFQDPANATAATACLTTATGLISAFAGAVHIPVVHTATEVTSSTDKSLPTFR